MVSDINIQRWISIGADPVHRPTLNGKAFLKKKTFCPSSLCPGGLWPALSLRSSFLCLLALLAGCARSCGDGSGCCCASSSRGRFPKACVRYRRFCYRGRSCRHRRGPIRQLFVARVLCSCSSVHGQEGYACISCMLRLCSGTAFQNQCGPADDRSARQLDHAPQLQLHLRPESVCMRVMYVARVFGQTFAFVLVVIAFAAVVVIISSYLNLFWSSVHPPSGFALPFENST